MEIEAVDAHVDESRVCDPSRLRALRVTLAVGLGVDAPARTNKIDQR